MSNVSSTEERLLQVIISPVLSEKSARVADAGQFAFRVATDASKPEIKAAVEQLFKVEVDSVRVVNLSGKVKRFRGHLGRRAGARKAYVKLKPGFDIDFVGA